MPAPVLACRLANYGPYQEAAWTHLPSIGIRHVFMNVPKTEEIEVVRDKLAAHNLTAVVFRGEADLSQPAALTRLAEQLNTCEQLGVRYLFLSPKRRGTDKEIIYKRLRRAGDIAQKHGVIISLETHPDLGTNGDVHRDTMRAIQHPNVRVNFDTANIHYYNQGTDAPAELKKIIDFVATVEVKDHNGQYMTWNFPALGQGIVDLPGVLRILRKHGYAGPLTMEIEGIKGIKRNQQEIEKDIANSADYLRSLQPFK